MAFNPLAGTSGSVKGVLISPDLTVDVATSAGTTVALVELSAWRMSVKNAAGKVITFNSGADAQGAVYPTILRGGITEWSVQMEGVYNGDPAASAQSWARLTPNAFIKFDLFYHTVGALGFRALLGKITSSETGTAAKGDPASFACTVEGSGVLVAPTFV